MRQPRAVPRAAGKAPVPGAGRHPDRGPGAVWQGPEEGRDARTRSGGAPGRSSDGAPLLPWVAARQSRKTTGPNRRWPQPGGRRPAQIRVAPRGRLPRRGAPRQPAEARPGRGGPQLPAGPAAAAVGPAAGPKRGLTDPPEWWGKTPARWAKAPARWAKAWARFLSALTGRRLPQGGRRLSPRSRERPTRQGPGPAPRWAGRHGGGRHGRPFDARGQPAGPRWTRSGSWRRSPARYRDRGLLC
jgi:hypothetical protein